MDRHQFVTELSKYETIRSSTYERTSWASDDHSGNLNKSLSTAPQHHALPLASESKASASLADSATSSASSAAITTATPPAAAAVASSSTASSSASAIPGEGFYEKLSHVLRSTYSVEQALEVEKAFKAYHVNLLAEMSPDTVTLLQRQAHQVVSAYKSSNNNNNNNRNTVKNSKDAVS